MDLKDLEYGNKVEIKTTNNHYKSLVVDGRSGFYPVDEREETITLRQEKDFDINKNREAEKYEAIFNDNDNDITKYLLVEKDGKRKLANKKTEKVEKVINISYRN